MIILLLLLSAGAFPAWAQKKAMVQTKWNHLDGMRNGEDIYFLSNYSLYLPGQGTGSISCFH